MNDLNALWGSAPGHLLASGKTGAILRSEDFGATWTTTRAGSSSDYVWYIWGSSAADIYAVGKGGLVLHSVDDGASWTPEVGGTSATLFGCAGRSADDVFCVGGGGVILHSSDHGATWVSIPSGTTKDLALPMPIAGSVVVAGNSGITLKYF
jgi:photosystem II stability/assembly factor-like uncharacterized protein